MKLINRFEDHISINDGDTSYIVSFEIHNTPVNVYISDYGQSYFYTYKNDEGEIIPQGCGTYNSDYLSDIIYTLDPKGFEISCWGEDDWNQRMKVRESRGLESIDYDDFELYDIEAMYKELEKEK